MYCNNTSYHDSLTDVSSKAEKISYVNFLNLIILIPICLLWAMLPNDAIALLADWFFKTIVDVMLELPFSRSMETEADEVGMLLAAKSCLDVREAPAFWSRMAVMQELHEEQMPEIVSSHPNHESRETFLAEKVCKK